MTEARLGDALTTSASWKEASDIADTASSSTSSAIGNEFLLGEGTLDTSLELLLGIDCMLRPAPGPENPDHATLLWDDAKERALASLKGLLPDVPSSEYQALRCVFADGRLLDAASGRGLVRMASKG